MIGSMAKPPRLHSKTKRMSAGAVKRAYLSSNRLIGSATDGHG